MVTAVAHHDGHQGDRAAQLAVELAAGSCRRPGSGFDDRRDHQDPAAGEQVGLARSGPEQDLADAVAASWSGLMARSMSGKTSVAADVVVLVADAGALTRAPSRLGGQAGDEVDLVAVGHRGEEVAVLHADRVERGRADPAGGHEAAVEFFLGLLQDRRVALDQHDVVVRRRSGCARGPAPPSRRR
jgi:hypothetical protein